MLSKRKPKLKKPEALFLTVARLKTANNQKWRLVFHAFETAEEAKLYSDWSPDDKFLGEYRAAATDKSAPEKKKARRLAAAAPDLLSALKGLVVEELLYESSENPKHRGICTRKINRARKAIAKAQGAK